MEPSRVRATYYDGPYRQAHPVTGPSTDRWPDDIVAAALAVIVLLAVFLIATAGATPVR